MNCVQDLSCPCYSYRTCCYSCRVIESKGNLFWEGVVVRNLKIITTYIAASIRQQGGGGGGGGGGN